MQDLSSRQGMAIAGGDDFDDSAIFFPVIGGELIKPKETVFDGLFRGSSDDTAGGKTRSFNPLMLLPLLLLAIPAAIWYAPPLHMAMVHPYMRDHHIPDPPYDDQDRPPVPPNTVIPANPVITYMKKYKLKEIKGAHFGTAGNGSNTYDKAFDWNDNTYFDSSVADQAFAGTIAPYPVRVYAIGWCPKQGSEGSMNGGVFEGSNSFLRGYKPLLNIPQTPPAGWYAYPLQFPSVPYKYLRYRGPAGSHGDIADIVFMTKKH
jgi:hypothetical protein